MMYSCVGKCFILHNSPNVKVEPCNVISVESTVHVLTNQLKQYQLSQTENMYHQRMVKL